MLTPPHGKPSTPANLWKAALEVLGSGPCNLSQVTALVVFPSMFVFFAPWAFFLMLQSVWILSAFRRVRPT